MNAATDILYAIPNVIMIIEKKTLPQCGKVHFDVFFRNQNFKISKFGIDNLLPWAIRSIFLQTDGQGLVAAKDVLHIRYLMIS